MSDLGNLSKGRLIKADLVSRSNAMNGKYSTAQLGLELDHVAKIDDNEITLLETLKIKADLADKMITEAESKGKNTNDPQVIKELGEKINEISGQPLRKNELKMTSVFNTVYLVIIYGVTFGIWGLVFKHAFYFMLVGVIIALFVGFIFVNPVVMAQRTKERVKDITFGASAIWITPFYIMGIAGLVVLLIKVIFF